MRLPIAITPLNLLLIALMVVAPQLGKYAREIVDEKKNNKSLDVVISRRANSDNGIKRKRTDNKRRKKTISRLAILEKAEQNKTNKFKDVPKNSRKTATFPSPSELHKGKKLLSKMKSDREAAKPKVRLSNTTEDKKSFINQLKDFARKQNYDEAEKIFMSRLENMELAPLESLEKQSKFRDHFSKLVKQLNSKTSRN